MSSIKENIKCGDCGRFANDHCSFYRTPTTSSTLWGVCDGAESIKATPVPRKRTTRRSKQKLVNVG